MNPHDREQLRSRFEAIRRASTRHLRELADPAPLTRARLIRLRDSVRVGVQLMTSIVMALDEEIHHTVIAKMLAEAAGGGTGEPTRDPGPHTCGGGMHPPHPYPCAACTRERAEGRRR